MRTPILIPCSPSWVPAGRVDGEPVSSGWLQDARDTLCEALHGDGVG